MLAFLREFRDGVPVPPRKVLSRAEEIGVSHWTVWQWVRRHGYAHLCLVLAAGVGERTLRSHLAAGTIPEEWALWELSGEQSIRPPRF